MKTVAQTFNKGDPKQSRITFCSNSKSISFGGCSQNDYTLEKYVLESMEKKKVKPKRIIVVYTSNASGG